MIFLSSCSNDQIKYLIIAATEELAKRAQAMGSLQAPQSMPVGWPQQPGFSGLPTWQPPAPPTASQNPAANLMQPSPVWNHQPIASPPTPLPVRPDQNPSANQPAQVVLTNFASSADNGQVNGTVVPAEAARATVAATQVEKARSAQPQFNSSAPTSSAPQEIIKPVTAEATVVSLAPAKAGVDHGDELLNKLVLIYQVATEYPVDLLEPDANLEADLGIDSVKQMQILGIVKEKFSFDLPEDMDMKELRTIREIADSIRPLAKLN
jgi:acyl carrier protein